MLSVVLSSLGGAPDLPVDVAEDELSGAGCAFSVLVLEAGGAETSGFGLVESAVPAEAHARLCTRAGRSAAVGGAGDEGGDGVGGVAVEADPVAVVSRGGAWVAV